MWVTVNSGCRSFGSPLSPTCFNLFSFIGTCVWFGCAKRVWSPSSSCFVFCSFSSIVLWVTLLVPRLQKTFVHHLGTNSVCVCVCFWTVCLWLSEQRPFTAAWARAVDGLQPYWSHICTHRVHTHINTARTGAPLMKSYWHKFAGNQSCRFITKSK